MGLLTRNSIEESLPASPESSCSHPISIAATCESPPGVSRRKATVSDCTFSPDRTRIRLAARKRWGLSKCLRYGNRCRITEPAIGPDFYAAKIFNLESPEFTISERIGTDQMQILALIVWKSYNSLQQRSCRRTAGYLLQTRQDRVIYFPDRFQVSFSRGYIDTRRQSSIGAVIRYLNR